MNRMKFLLLILCASFFCVSNNSPPPENKRMIVGTEDSYYPYGFRNVKGDLVGYHVDLAKDIAKKLNKKIVLKPMNLKGLIQALEKGDIDMISTNLLVNEKRKKEMILIPYSNIETDSIYLVFLGTVPSDITSLEALKKYTKLPFALLSGSFEEDIIKSLGSGFNYQLMQNYPEMIVNLQFQRSFAIILDEVTAIEYKKQFPELQWIKLPVPKEKKSQSQALAINKNNTKLAQEVSQAIEELNKEGVFKRLNKEWLDINGAPRDSDNSPPDFRIF